jgi:hypothetical protein
MFVIIIIICRRVVGVLFWRILLRQCLFTREKKIDMTSFKEQLRIFEGELIVISF